MPTKTKDVKATALKEEKVEKAEKPKVEKKKTTAKPAVKKAAAKPVKKDTKKKVVAKPKKDVKKKAVAKPKATKKVTKKESPKKKATKQSVTKEASISKTQAFVAEAIAKLATEDNQWVSAQRIKAYAWDYNDNIKIETMIKPMIGRAITSMTELGLLKQKRNSFSFTAKGVKTVKPDTLPKRSKLTRKEKEVAAPEPPAVQETEDLRTGRVSKKVMRD